MTKYKCCIKMLAFELNNYSVILVREVPIDFEEFYFYTDYLRNSIRIIKKHE